MNKVQSHLVVKYHQCGFKMEKEFFGEYVLMMNDKFRKVRIYTDGRARMTNPQTGVYEPHELSANARRGPTQADQILSALLSGQRITAIYALREIGCFRLAARISDLKRDGHDIKSEPYSYKTESGETKTISRYWMEAEKNESA